ncbi:MAG: 4Fe-4S dicluster domain-containing protein [Clostridiales bacterium]|nr:4Fe-4S dicluster domain-containing protein [Clostridiales bacterium]
MIYLELKEVVRLINGKLLYETEEIMNREYSYAVASDLMSNVMLETADDSILITSLVNPQVIRASEMMNITCIIITCGKTVTDMMMELAKNRNIALVETEDTTFTVCGKLHSLGMREGPISGDGGHVTSIRLAEKHCIGCIHCVRNCPTEAIRIRNWKAFITPERCIECGMCIKVCPRHAIKPVVDTLDTLKDYDYRIAIPASAFLGQFRNVKSRNHLLTALKQVGFDDVYEEAIGAEMISHATRKLLKSGRRKLPLISSGCPSVLKLIQVRFPNLIEHVLDYRPPVEVVAGLARKDAETKYPDKKIGIFFIAPCTAKISFIKESGEIIETDIDEMVAISDVYKLVLKNLKELEGSQVEELEKTGVMGLRWTNTGGEAIALDTDKFIAVDGIHEVMDILEKIEDEKIDDLEFVEADACVGGCFGGSLTVEDIYSAKSNMKIIIDEAKEKYGNSFLYVSRQEGELDRNRELTYRPVLRLDDDLNVSMKKMEEMKRIVKELPGIDCGVCGAPTCKAFAEDVVRGQITERACIINSTMKRR